MTVRNTRKNSIRSITCRLTALILTVVTLVTSVPAGPLTIEAEAAAIAVGSTQTGRKLTLKACRNLAIQTSMEYDNAESAVESKGAAYESAVKAIALKEKNLSTFRWSPLLSFKFPTKPNFEEASEFQYKPVALQYEIKVAQHNLQDKVYAIGEKVNNLYVEIVVLQRTIAFNEARMKTLEDGLARNQTKLRVGQANQADVDKIQKNLDSVKNKVASDRRTLEADLKKMSSLVGLDVTTGYSFENPYVTARIERSQLDALKQYTADRDEAYYEACIAETTARAELNTNYKLVRNKYGGDANMIAGYVSLALNGGNVNKKGFKNSYKAFLTQIDSYWQGKKRIIFFKIPRIWFKGSLDGTRYIEDDPYVLYQNVLDYCMATNEKKAAREQLDQSVEDSFNNYVSVRNSYEQYLRDVDDAEEKLKASEVRNRIGELTFEEYDSEMTSYEDLENGMLDAMKLYTQTLYSFDRLTCGGVSALLAGTDADMQTAVVGESYVQKNTADGAYYTLTPIIQSQEFELTITIPDDFEVDVTDYELWVDNVQIGERMPKDKKIRHLMLTVDSVSDVKIRLYDGDKFVDDCVIDPSEESGPLTITTGYEVKKNESNVLGRYEITMNDATDMVELKITPANEDVKSFKVLNEDGKALGGDKNTEVDKTFKYLSLLAQSIDDLRIELYDGSGSLVDAGRFVALSGEIVKAE